MKEPLTTPFEIEHIGVLTALPDNVHVTSIVEKPEPVTSTTEPAAAEVGLIVMEGGINAVTDV